MNLSSLIWDDFATYLFIDRKMSQSKGSFQSLRSRFFIIQKHFQTKDFNRKNFNDFVQKMLAEKKAHATVNNYIKLSKHIDKYLNINELRDYTHFKEIVDNDVDCLTPAEIIKMAEVRIPYSRNMDELNQRNKVLVHFLARTGCRRNEARDLKWEDVREGPYGGYVIFRNTKSKENRHVPVTKELYDYMKNLPVYGDYVFSGPDGKQLDFSWILDDFKRRAVTVGIKKRVYLHLFRHSYITEMNTLVENPTDLAKLVGHHSPEVTMRYIHPIEENTVSLVHLHPLENQGLGLKWIGKMIYKFASRLANPRSYYVSFSLDDDQLELKIRRKKQG